MKEEVQLLIRQVLRDYWPKRHRFKVLVTWLWEHETAKLSAFHTACHGSSEFSGPRRSPTVSHTEDLEAVITRRVWSWRVLQMDPCSISRGPCMPALRRTPQGKRKHKRPKQTWRRTVEGEMKDLGHTWSSLGSLAKERQQWRLFVAALNASECNGQ
ncbi:hypothetical protein JOB18_049042 [Solea senegalensis]|uniref:Uncharacterized protein n=1 Tax=Solea senegalensis TaxID=28829 RepID=A0AAV6Q991_SOLSE|nr:hypothetical protein JOB18_049042 [Solea senegalensis]